MIGFLIISTLVIAPAAILLYYFWVRDRWEREPIKVILTLFGAGCISVAPAAILEFLLGVGFNIDSIGEAFLAAFVSAGFIEELVKFAFIYFLTFKSIYFREEYDGIIYAVAVGLGFAFAENIFYAVAAFGESGMGMATIVTRAFTAVPSHALDGVVMGYFIGKAHFMKDRTKRISTYLTGIGIAILFHGFYDFFVFLLQPLPIKSQGWCIVGLIWVIIVQWGTAHRLVRAAQQHSGHRWGFQLHPSVDDYTEASSNAPGKIEQPPPQLPFPSGQPPPVPQADIYAYDNPEMIDPDEKTQRRFCRYCGGRIGAGASFCNHCGTKL